MNSFIRALMFIYSVVIAVISVVLLYALVDDGIFADILSPLSTIVTGPVSRYIYLGVLMLLFITSIVSIMNIITSGRLNRTRLRKNDIVLFKASTKYLLHRIVKVEIPSSMAKVQEKVKKDIERYTGIAVEQVIVRVSKVEQAQTKVESR